MADLQKEFREELQSQKKRTIVEYAELLDKHIILAIAGELENGASEKEAETMGHYYTVTVLSNFISSENKLTRILALLESE